MWGLWRAHLEKLRERDLFSLEQRRLRENLLAVFSYLKDVKEKTASLHLEEASERTRNNGHRLQQEKWSLELKKKILSVRMFQHWNRFHREIVKSPSLEIFKTCLDRVLDNMI